MRIFTIPFICVRKESICRVTCLFIYLFVFSPNSKCFFHLKFPQLLKSYPDQHISQSYRQWDFFLLFATYRVHWFCWPLSLSALVYIVYYIAHIVSTSTHTLAVCCCAFEPFVLVLLLLLLLSANTLSQCDSGRTMERGCHRCCVAMCVCVCLRCKYAFRISSGKIVSMGYAFFCSEEKTIQILPLCMYTLVHLSSSRKESELGK